jgi:hypothetical protein
MGPLQRVSPCLGALHCSAKRLLAVGFFCFSVCPSATCRCFFEPRCDGVMQFSSKGAAFIPLL